MSGEGEMTEGVGVSGEGVSGEGEMREGVGVSGEREMRV